MDNGSLFLLIPITAIVLGIGKGIVHSILQTYERVHMARLDIARSNVTVIDQDGGGLRDEIIKLRDTTTQHSISLQHAVERLEQRVDFLERKTSTVSTPVEVNVEPPPLQIVGRS